MIPLNTFFWMVVLMFGLIGALRGWVRELLVTLAIIAAYFLRWLALNIIPFLREYLNGRSALDQFYIFGTLFVVMALFGYAGPVMSPYLAGKARREKIQDLLLGLVVGAMNGYLLAGTIWGFLHAANYGLPPIPPDAPPEVVQQMKGLWGIRFPDSDVVKFAETFLPQVWMNDTLMLILTGVTLIVVLVVLL
ncbi:MAG: CvpA family protein [Thermoflexia bacterium]|nr:MAG: CvpA family protein [Thermoflexia bacterium]